MVIFGIVALSPLALSLFFPNLKTNKTSKIVFGILCCIAMCFVLGFKNYHLGPDDLRIYYENMQDAINSVSWKSFYDSESNLEAGYQMFVWLLSRIFRHPQWLYIIVAIICSVSVICFSFRYSENPVLSITLFITVAGLTFEMSAIRQSIAMSICLCSVKFIKNGKFIPFVLVVLSAMLFHLSAIVFLPIYFLRKFKYNFVGISVILIVFIAAFLLIEPLIDWMNALLNRKNEYDSGHVFESGGAIAVTIYVLIVLVSVIFNGRLKKNGRDTFFFYMLLVGFACYILRYTTIQIAERISFYFAFAQIILLPNTLACFKEKEKFLITGAVYLLAFLLFMYRISSSLYVPFLFFWD